MLADASLEFLDLLIDKLTPIAQSNHLEVQERASSVLALFSLIRSLHAENAAVHKEVSALFEGELNPVAAKAQRKVPLPEGIDLDEWIHEPVKEEENDLFGDAEGFTLGGAVSSEFSPSGRHESSDEEERDEVRPPRLVLS